MYTVDEAHQHLMRTVGYMGRSNDGSGIGGDATNPGGPKPYPKDRKDDDGLSSEKADENCVDAKTNEGGQMPRSKDDFKDDECLPEKADENSVGVGVKEAGKKLCSAGGTTVTEKIDSNMFGVEADKIGPDACTAFNEVASKSTTQDFDVGFADTTEEGASKQIPCVTRYQDLNSARQAVIEGLGCNLPEAEETKLEPSGMLNKVCSVLNKTTPDANIQPRDIMGGGTHGAGSGGTTDGRPGMEEIYNMGQGASIATETHFYPFKGGHRLPGTFGINLGSSRKKTVSPSNEHKPNGSSGHSDKTKHTDVNGLIGSSSCYVEKKTNDGARIGSAMFSLGPRSLINETANRFSGKFTLLGEDDNNSSETDSVDDNIFNCRDDVASVDGSSNQARGDDCAEEANPKEDLTITDSVQGREIFGRPTGGLTDDGIASMNDLSEGWKPVLYKRATHTETHYLSPELKLKFKSFKRAKEFDALLTQYLGNEKSAIVKYKSKVGGYVKLRSYVFNLSNLRKKYPFLRGPAVGREIENRSVVTVDPQPVASQGGPSKSRLQASCAAKFDQHDPPINSSFIERENFLRSKGWTKIQCDNCNRCHWLTQQRKRGFRCLKLAEEYNEIINQCNGSEDDAWSEYSERMKKRHRKVSATVLSGLCLERATHMQSVDSLLEFNHDRGVAENDDECFICEEGGDLICCDYCAKSFHRVCHVPKLYQKPPGKWKCCECKAPEMPLTRCGECKDCTTPGNPIPICKFMRHAEPETLPQQGKHVPTHHLSKRPNPSNTARETSGKALSCDTRRVRARLLSKDEVGMMKAKASPESRLVIARWSVKKVTEARQSRKYFVSPARKITFKRSKAAIEFELLRQKYDGDEFQAWSQFRLNHQENPSRMNVIKPQQYDTTTKSATQARVELLISRGWETILASSGKGRKYWISPGQKLKFKSSTEATKFSDICERNGKDETSLFSKYAQELKQRCERVSDVVVGGEGAVTRKEPQGIHRAMPRPSKPRIKESLGPGWLKKPVFTKTQWRNIYLSPSLGIQFRYLRDANMYHSLLQKNGGDEMQAWNEYTAVKRHQKLPRLVLNVKQIDLLSSGPRPPQNNVTKRLVSKTPSCMARRVQARLSSQDEAVCETGSTLCVLPRSGRSAHRAMPRPSKPRIKESLGPGWLKKPLFMKTQWRNIYQSPSLGIQFRYLSDANMYHSLLQKNGGDERQAWNEYTAVKSHQKLPRRVCNVKQIDLLSSGPRPPQNNVTKRLVSKPPSCTARRVQARLSSQDEAKETTEEKASPESSLLPSSVDTKLKSDSAMPNTTITSINSGGNSGSRSKTQVHKHHEFLISKGYRMLSVKLRCRHRNYWRSTKHQLTFKFPYAAEKFERTCEECRGQTKHAVELYCDGIKRMGRKVSYFVVGGANAFEKISTLEPSPITKSCSTKQVSTVPDCTSSNRDQKRLKHSSAESTSIPTVPFCRWSKVKYSVKGRTIFFRKTPHHEVVFRSEKSAASFDRVLQTHPDNETEALDKFVKKVGYDKFRNIVQNMGTYRVQQSSEAQTPTPSKKPQKSHHSKKELKLINNSEGNIVAEDFYEVDSIVGQRSFNGQMNYLVRWKGCSSEDDTWVPEKDLCDTAMVQASALTKKVLDPILKEAIEAMKKIDKDCVFYDPITDDMAPEYSTIIKNPMCIAVINEKVLKSQYKNTREFGADALLMYSNCIKFNNDTEDNWYRREAERQRQIFRKTIYPNAKAELENKLNCVRAGSRFDSSFKTKGSARSTQAIIQSCNAPSKKRKKSSSLSALSSSSPKRMSVVCMPVHRPLSSFVPPIPVNTLGGKQIQYFKTGTQKCSFFGDYFKGGTLLRLVSSKDEGVEKIIPYGGKEFELVSCKELKKEKAFHGFSTNIEIEYLYVLAEENGVKKNLQHELGKLFRLGSLGSQKVIARLGHLQSEAKMVQYIDHTNIEIIKEEGHEGCGFVPAGFFRNIKDCPMRKSDYVVQIRIVAPKLGLLKGLLLEKEGINRIQIPESMIKALPVEDSDEDWAAVIFKKVSAPSEPNKLFGRQLDPNEDPPNSYKKSKPKELKEMHRRLLLGFGVPESLCINYVKQSQKVDRLRHTYLMGVADPTGKIPYGKIFIPGYALNTKSKTRDLFGCCLKYGKVYVSRSPCVEPGDAKILDVLSSKPKGMSSGDWDALCRYDFGTVIFGLPVSKDDIPIPNLVGDGDLDGDGYFILWDEDILGSMLHPKSDLSRRALRDLTTLKALDQKVCSVDKTSKLDKPYRDDWFATAQKDMMNIKKMHLASKLVGHLYGLCTDFSDIYDEDAMAFAKAYKNALDIQKHGGRVYLPAHLHEKVKHQDLQELLSSDI